LNILHIVSLLYIEKRTFLLQYYICTKSKEEATKKIIPRYNFTAAYKLWGNPQLLDVTQSPTLSTPLTSEKKARSGTYLVFFIFRLIKLSLYYFLHNDLIPRCIFHALGDLHAEDFSPAHSHLFPNIYIFNQRQLAIRAYIALSWIYEGFLLLDTANCILAILFVAVGLDEPSDWPILFGNPAAATSLRRFWGKFWHQVGVRTYTNYGKLLAANLKLSPKSTYSKTLVAFTVFLLSGLSHSVVSYNLGNTATWQLDTYWFLLNFLICTLEILLLSLLKAGTKTFGWSRRLKRVQESWAGKSFGYIWVFLFFWWSVPMWKYPGLYAQAVIRADNERWMQILQTALIVN